MIGMTRRIWMAGMAAAAGASAGTAYRDVETRIARRDFRELYREDLPTPCMVVDLELFEANLKKMAAHCKTTGLNLRGHVKVHKSPEIAKRQIALGGIGVTCATVAECELMAANGIRG